MIFDDFKKEYESFDPVWTNFDWANKEKYAMFITQVYHFVCQSSRLMSAVASKLPAKHERIHAVLLQHANEEKGHQFLAVSDLKAMGYTTESFPQLNSTRCFWETQYYKANYENPLSFYGYALALEGAAVMRLKEIYEKCSEAHGDKASRFFMVHMEDDIGHIEMTVRELDKLDEVEKDCIRQNLNQSIYSFTNMLNEIEEYVNQRSGLSNVA